MTNKLLLLGGGGHCKSVLDSLFQCNRYEELAIIDRRELIGHSVLGVPIIGCDDDLPRLYNQGFTYAFISVGNLGNPRIRIKLFDKLMEIGFKIPIIKDPTAVVSSETFLGSGVFVGKNAVINAGTTVGKCAIINTSVTVEHDCIIEDFVHLAPGTILCGEVQVGRNTHIGANSVIKQRLTIGSDCLIGMGSVVVADLGNSIIAYGNPCKMVREL